MFAEPHRANLCRETACDDGGGIDKSARIEHVGPSAGICSPAGRTDVACVTRKEGGVEGGKGDGNCEERGRQAVSRFRPIRRLIAAT